MDPCRNSHVTKWECWTCDRFFDTTVAFRGEVYAVKCWSSSESGSLHHCVFCHLCLFYLLVHYACLPFCFTKECLLDFVRKGKVGGPFNWTNNLQNSVLSCVRGHFFEIGFWDIRCQQKEFASLHQWLKMKLHFLSTRRSAWCKFHDQGVRGGSVWTSSRVQLVVCTRLQDVRRSWRVLEL